MYKKSLILWVSDVNFKDAKDRCEEMKALILGLHSLGRAPEKLRSKDKDKIPGWVRGYLPKFMADQCPVS
jgi:hypothetical protein